MSEYDYDPPEKLMDAHRLVALSYEALGDLWWFTVALSILHGTFPGEAPTLRLAVPIMQTTAGVPLSAASLADIVNNELSPPQNRALRAQLDKLN